MVKYKSAGDKNGGYANNSAALSDFSASQLKSIGGNARGLTFNDANGILVIKKNNLKEFENAKNSAIAAALEEIGLRAERHAKLECPVDTGRLRNSITHQIKGADSSVLVGSNVEYCEYVEKNDKATHINGKYHFLHDAGANHSSEYSKVLESKLKNS